MKTLSDHILDIIQNSVSAGATWIEIMVEENKIDDICSLKIKDNGSGMDKVTLGKAASPFFTTRTTRKVGLGLALLKQNAEQAGGSFKIDSEIGKGTQVEAVFQLSHLDRPELGDVWETFYLTMLGHQNTELIYRHKTDRGNYEIRSSEILEMLEGVPLQKAEIKNAITELIKNNIEEIQPVTSN